MKPTQVWISLMWGWVICFNPTVFSRTLQTVPQALLEVFPKDAAVQEKHGYIVDDKIPALKACLGRHALEVQNMLVTYFEGVKNNHVISRAYIDLHQVRKETQTLMVVLGPGATLEQIKVLAFNEPKEYLLSADWMKDFEALRKKAHNAHLPAANATLTVKAIEESVNKVMCVDKILFP